MPLLTQRGPLGSTMLQALVRPETSLAAILRDLGIEEPPESRGHLIVYAGDTLISRDRWDEYVPQDGCPILVQEVPAGGGGDGTKALRTVLMVAIMVAAGYVGGSPAVAGVLGKGGALTAGALIGMTGMLAVNALLPLRMPTQGALTQEISSQAYAWQGARNRANPYGVVPRVLGRHRIYPCYAATPYSQIIGSEHYLHVLLDCGHGPLLLEDLRIGETPIGELADPPEVEIRAGWSTDTPIGTANLSVTAQAVQTTLLSGVEHTFATGTEADEAHLELQFAGLVQFVGGLRQTRDVAFEVSYRATGGTGAWLRSGIIGRNDEVWTGATQTATYDNADWALREYTTTYALNASWLSCWIAASEDPEVTEVTISVGAAGEDRASKRASLTVPASELPKPVSVGGAAPGAQNTILVQAWKPGAPVYNNETGTYTPGEKISAALAGVPTISAVSYASADVVAAPIVFSDKRETMVLRGIRIVFPSRGQYDVRVSRVTADSSDVAILDVCTWTALQTVRKNGPADRLAGKRALIGLVVRATDQLQGVLDQISVVATSCLPWYDGEEWVVPSPEIPHATANPAWCYAEIFRGEASGKPLADSRIDGAGLLRWGAWCDVEAYRCNLVLDWPMTRWEALTLVAATGRAAPGMTDSWKYTVVHDVPQTTPVQLFTPRNSWGYAAERYYLDELHGLRVRYPNEANGWQIDERVVYQDGYSEANATELETLEILGVTDPDQIFKLARYRMADARLRATEVHSWHADIEHLACRRGSLVLFQHDVPMLGIQSGRIKRVFEGEEELAGTWFVEMDQAMPMEAGTDYGLKVRTATLAQVSLAVVTEAGEHTTLELTAQPPAGVAAGDLAAFGELGSETVPMLVRSIESGPDLSARITAVPYAAGVYTADTEEIPAWDSQITRPPALQRALPPAPVIREMFGRRVRGQDGTRATILVVAYYVPSGTLPVVQLRARWQEAGDTGWTDLPPLTQMVGEFSVSGVEAGRTYRVRLQTVSHLGLTAETYATALLVIETTPPADVAWLTAAIEGGGIRLTWEENLTDTDLDGYELRVGASWDAGAVIDYLFATTYLYRHLVAGEYQFWVKSVDTSDNYATTAAGASLEIIAPSIVQGLDARVIDNFALLSWLPPAVHTLPIDHYRVSRGINYPYAELIGTTGGTFQTVFESQSGEYKYWVVAVDAAGNVGTETRIIAQIAQPPDFVLRADIDLLADGTPTLTNAVESEGRLYLPIVTGRTIAEHFTDNSWTSPADQVAAGYPYWIQPAAETGSIVYGWDFGATIPSSRVAVSLDSLQIAAGAEISVTIELSADAETWDSHEGTEVFGIDFRYVRVTVAAAEIAA